MGGRRMLEVRGRPITRIPYGCTCYVCGAKIHDGEAIRFTANAQRHWLCDPDTVFTIDYTDPDDLEDLEQLWLEEAFRQALFGNA